MFCDIIINMNNKETKRKLKIGLGVVLISIGPLLLITCPMVTSSLGYNMLSLSSHISASEPNFDTISVFINLWWLGILITILGTVIGTILISKQKKK